MDERIFYSGHRPRVKYLNRKLLRIRNKREIVVEQKNYMWVDLTSHRLSVIFRDYTAVLPLYLTITKIRFLVSVTCSK
jgi:hypothetical protein